MTRIIAVALAALALAFVAPASAQSFTDASVVAIRCTSPDGATIIRGSGVIVSENGAVLTAKHVVRDGYECVGSIGIGVDANPAGARRLLRRHPVTNYDATLLEFVRAPSDVFAPVRWADRASARQDARITIYGFPAGGTG